MLVREILEAKEKRLHHVQPDESIEAATARMRIDDVGALLVLGAAGELLGMLSEKDVVHAISDCGGRALSMPVRARMQTRVMTCEAGDTIARLARRMTAHRARHVPVMDGRIPVGMVSLGDIVHHRSEEMELECGTLRDLALSHQLAG